MGRKNRSDRRKKEILQAYTDCVIEHGLHRASFDVIAQKLGLDRSSIYHYFKSQDDLISQWIDHVIEQYGNASENSLKKAKAEAPDTRLIEHIFTDMHSPLYSRVMDELSVLANRDDKAAAELKRLYAFFEANVINHLVDYFPDTPFEIVERIGSAIVQLGEGSSTFYELGFGQSRVEYAKSGALILLDMLRKYDSLTQMVRIDQRQGKTPEIDLQQG